MDLGLYIWHRDHGGEFIVAMRSRLGSAANLRLRLRRMTGLSPSAYRARFAPLPTVAPVLARVDR